MCWKKGKYLKRAPIASCCNNEDCIILCGVNKLVKEDNGILPMLFYAHHLMNTRFGKKQINIF